MCKNIVNIMLDNKLPENTADMIMKYHGGVDSWLPEGMIEKIPDKIRELIRKDNFEITYREQGWEFDNYYESDNDNDTDNASYTKSEIIGEYFEINVDKSIIQNIIDKCVRVNYVYKGRKQNIWDSDWIKTIEGNYIWTTRHQCLCLDKFDYLKITVLLSDHDDGETFYKQCS